ncbi:MAG: ATP-binding protein [Clostridia bacterium]|nr:ATP-binding protein [Clostridia bacterium]
MFVFYDSKILDAADESLDALAASMDHSVQNVFDYIRTETTYTLNSGVFKAAEAEYINTGNSAPLIRALCDSVVAKDDLTRAFLVIEDGRVQFASVTYKNYKLDSIQNNTITACTDIYGKTSLAYIQKSPKNNIYYGVLLDTLELYKKIAGSVITNDSQVVLLEPASGVVLHRHNGIVYTESADVVTGATCAPNVIGTIRKFQDENQKGRETYNYWDMMNSAEYTSRMLVVPTDHSDNGMFTVSVASRYDIVIKPVYSLIGVICCMALLILCCVGVIVFEIEKRYRKNRELEEEVNLLKEKNSELAQIEARRQELAHADRLETIGTFTSGITHEFNNLLTPIMSYSILSMEKLNPNDEELAEYMEKIYDTSLKAKKLVTRIGDLSRKNTEDTRGYVDVRTLFKNAMMIAHSSIPEGISIKTDYEKGCMIYGNEVQVLQLVLNIIINAVQAMGTEGRLELSVSRSEGRIVASVRDTGPGIPEDIMPHIFEPFFTTKRAGKGTGLGLAIAAQAAEDNEGSIKVENAADGGCLVTISFPEARMEENSEEE